MVQEMDSSKAPERLLIVGCIIGLLLIALVGGTSHLLMQQQIAEQQSGANIVNLSGRQRMLSQRLSKNALKLQAVTTSAELETTLTELQQSLAVLKKTHRGLIHGDPELELPGGNSKVVAHLFEEIEPYYQQLVNATEQLLQSKGMPLDQLQQSQPVKNAAMLILENEGPFLSGMSRIVFQYASESEERLERTNELENVLFYSGVIILLLEGIFIFRPIIQRTLTTMALLRQSEHRLKQTRRHLEHSISDLGEAQENLLEVEKKAVLASVVAGVTHDVNTPLGVSVTAASSLRDHTKELIALYRQDNLSRAKLEDYQSVATESTDIILNNLNKAAELIRNFKQLAIDQSSEQRRRFNLRNYLDDILLGLSSRIRTTDHQVNIRCSDDIQLDSYPGALYQVVSNLIMNSLIHGFDGRSSGTIDIEAQQQGDRLQMIYRDDGNGMDAETEKRCFDPFFTTRREQGGSGIGTHVIKSLVEDTLDGVISLTTAPGQGAEFKISFPIVAND